LENGTFDTGSDIKLECKAEGFPIPKITWLKNNARLPKSKRIYQKEEKYLIINRASPIGKLICYDSLEQPVDYLFTIAKTFMTPKKSYIYI
jgi:hypothetical protein